MRKEIKEYFVSEQQDDNLNLLCAEYRVAKADYQLAKDEKELATNDIKELLKGADDKINAGRYITSQYEVLISCTDKKISIDTVALQKADPELFKKLVQTYPKVTEGFTTLKSVELREK